jgi:uncharacterized protein (DUF2236 family)
VFPDDSVIRRVNREGVLLLGGGRALLLQLAHPKVAQGVADHSDFESRPFQRLWRTLDASYAMVFGSAGQARATAARLRQVHEGVTGPGYAANDPDLLFWVHATLIDTALRVHGLFFRPLSAFEYESYYEDAKAVAEILGVPRERQPERFAGFVEYMRRTVPGLEVTPAARRLAGQVLAPPLPCAAAPLVALGRELTVGLLPRGVRAKYGYPWSPARERALRASMLASRIYLPLVPAPVRQAPARMWGLLAGPHRLSGGTIRTDLGAPNG